MRALTQLDAEERASKAKREYDDMLMRQKTDYDLKLKDLESKIYNKRIQGDRDYESQAKLRDLLLQFQTMIATDEYQSNKPTPGWSYMTPLNSEGEILLDEFETGGVLNPFVDSDAYKDGSMFLRGVNSQMKDLLKEGEGSLSRQTATSETKSIFDALNSDRFDTSEEGGRNRNLVELLGAMLKQLDPKQEINYNWEKEEPIKPKTGSYGRTWIDR